MDTSKEVLRNVCMCMGMGGVGGMYVQKCVKVCESMEQYEYVHV